MTLDEQLNTFVEDLTLIDDAQERLAWVTDRGKRAPAMPATLKTEDRKVQGCISSVWVDGTLLDGRMKFLSDADSPLVKGLVHAVVGAYDGATPAEIAADTRDVLAEAGLAQNLSPTRQNGLKAVRRRVGELARGLL